MSSTPGSTFVKNMHSGKQLIAEGRFGEAAKAFWRAASAAKGIDDGALEATASLWRAACDIVSRDFAEASTFREMQGAYDRLVASAQDDRLPLTMGATGAFCRAWIYIIEGGRHVVRADVIKDCDETEHLDSALGVAAHVACALALCRPSVERLQRLLEAQARIQFKLFLGCINSKADLPNVPSALKEALGKAHHRILRAQDGNQDALWQPIELVLTDDIGESIGTMLGVEESSRVVRCIRKWLPVLHPQDRPVVGVLAYAALWLLLLKGLSFLWDISTAGTFLTTLGAFLGAVVGRRLLARHWKWVLLVDIFVGMVLVVIAAW